MYALFAGVAIACQTGSNSQFKEKLGEPTAALVANYAVALGCVVLYMLLTTQPMSSLQKSSEMPWWAWLGGLLGSVSGIIAIILAKRLGAGALAAFALAGQLVASVCSTTLDGSDLNFTFSIGRVWRAPV